MSGWRDKSKVFQKPGGRKLPVVEVLESRVLYSADSLASLLPLLLPDALEDTPEFEVSPNSKTPLEASFFLTQQFLNLSG